MNKSFLLGQESAGESFYMLFRAIKHQVDKGPVDAVTGKAKYTLNDNRLLREDVEYRTLVRISPIVSPALEIDTIFIQHPRKIVLYLVFLFIFQRDESWIAQSHLPQ